MSGFFITSSLKVSPNVFLSSVPMLNLQTFVVLANTTNVCKFNIGTELRKTFGDTLREEVIKNPDTYDRIKLINSTIPRLKEVTIKVLENISKI